MEVNNNHHEEREISSIDDTLPSLYKKGLLTAIECRIILCARVLPEKQLVLFRIVLSKNQQNAANLVEVFRAMTHRLHTPEKLKLQESEHNHEKIELDSHLEVNKNPMLIDTVIKCVSRFLPLDDIKNCRMVSRQWNSTAEVLLQKRAKIHFRPDGLRPENFLAVSKFFLPDLPFPAFIFSDGADTGLYWRVPELKDFFERWGENIKELNLDNIHIECAHDSSKSYSQYDITSWLKLASKITSLTIKGSEDDEEQLDMSLSLGDSKFLPEINSFKMKGNSIETFSGKEVIRMVPVNIELSNIICERDNEIVDEFCYNDFFDFSQAKTIKLSNCNGNMSEAIFDMSDQVFKNADLLYLNDITVKNWKKARGTVRHIELISSPFTEKSHLEIKSLQLSLSEIDLFALPRAIERIELNDCVISCSGPLSLPKLKFFKLQLKENNASQLTRFRLEVCENLKELVLCYYLIEETSLTRMFDVRSLPINLQVLRLNGNLQSYLTDDWILEIPGLIVLDAEFGRRFSDYTRICKKFHTGTLVVACYATMKVSTIDIVEFLLANMQKGRKRIFIGMKNEEDDLHSQTSFEGSLFSNIVDEKSNYYEFENSFGIVGKSITRSQFLNGCVSVADESIPFFLREE